MKHTCLALGLSAASQVKSSFGNIDASTEMQEIAEAQALHSSAVRAHIQQLLDVAVWESIPFSHQAGGNETSKQ